MCCQDSPTAAPEPKETEFSRTLASIMRERNESGKKFNPLEDQLIGSVQQFQTPEFQQREAGKALADVEGSFGAAKAQSDAELSSMGVNPASGAYGDRNLKMALGLAGARSGAMSRSRDSTRRLAFDTLAGVSGRGDAKIGQAIGAANSGASDYSNRQRNQMDWQAQQSKDSDMSGLGSLIGVGLSMFSSRKLKKDVTPVKGALKQVRQMPAKNWTYKGDTERHVGPMAEDVKKATGRGDGRMLHLPDLIGVQQAAIKELDAKVAKLEKKGRRK